MMTKEQILQRASELQKQAESLRSNLDAVVGAIQDCGYWLKVLEEGERVGNLSEASSPRE